MLEKNYAPTVPGLPYFGNIFQFLNNPRDYFTECAEKMGTVYRVKTPLGYATIVCGRRCLDLLKAETESGVNRAGLFHAFTTEVGVDIFETSGEPHRASREIVKLPYSRHVTAQFVPEMQQVIKRRAGELNDGQPVDFFKFCNTTTLHAAMSTMSPTPMEDLTDCFLSYADRVMDVITQRAPHMSLAFPWYKRRKNAVHQRVDEFIAKHHGKAQEAGGKTYVVDAVLKSFGGDLNDENLEKIRGVCIYSLAGALVYTSRIVFFFLFEILNNPTLRNEILHEIEAAFPDGKLDSMLFRKMPIVRSAYLEVLRLFPLLPGLPFQTFKDVEYAGFHIPKDEKLIFVPNTEHFSEENFPKPFEFNPYRFLPTNPNRYPKLSYFPFGLRERSCATRGSVEVSILSIVCGLLMEKDWQLTPSGQQLRLKMNPLIGPSKRILVTPSSHRGVQVDEKFHLSESFDFSSPFSEDTVDDVLPDSAHIVFKQGHIIVDEGEEADAFYMISSGEVEVIKNGVKVADLEEGDAFGEIGLLQQGKRTAQVRAASAEVHCVKLIESEFLKLLIDLDLEGDELKNMLQRHFIYLSIKRSIPNLDERHLEGILEGYSFEHFANEKLIIKQGDAALHFYVLLAGEVEVISVDNEKSISLATLKQGEVFGELGIINKAPRNANVKAKSDVTVLKIPRENLLKLLDSSDVMKRDIFTLIFSRLNHKVKSTPDRVRESA